MLPPRKVLKKYGNFPQLSIRVSRPQSEEHILGSCRFFSLDAGMKTPGIDLKVWSPADPQLRLVKIQSTNQPANRRWIFVLSCYIQNNCTKSISGYQFSRDSVTATCWDIGHFYVLGTIYLTDFRLQANSYSPNSNWNLQVTFLIYILPNLPTVEP